MRAEFFLIPYISKNYLWYARKIKLPYNLADLVFVSAVLKNINIRHEFAYVLFHIIDSKEIIKSNEFIFGTMKQYNLVYIHI